MGTLNLKTIVISIFSPVRSFYVVEEVWTCITNGVGRSKKFKTEEAAVHQKPHLLTTLTGKNQTNSDIGEKEESSFSITASRKRI